jgi:demethylmenaquinone methyltransferase/2-methoxy-6-polyprenyl-1,4-benzoquinol methylase
MFGRIARRYDLANRLLSGGLDAGWRRRLVAAVRRSRPRDVLDLATGSGEVALALCRGLPAGVNILGVDFCRPMLDEAERKRAAGGGSFENVRFAEGNALALSLPEGSFDAVTIAFGLRNMEDRAQSLREMRRVLRPNGRVFVLEFSRPRRWLAPLYRLYLRRLLPRIAGWVTGDAAAYDYLGRTIGAFPNADALSAEIEAAGFRSVKATALTFGIVALHEAVARFS